MVLSSSTDCFLASDLPDGTPIEVIENIVLDPGMASMEFDFILSLIHI